MFRYNGVTEYVVSPAVGRLQAKKASGHWFEDYHRNRQLFIRPLGRGKYHVKMVVLGTVTTDNEMTRQGLVSWAINNLQFQLTDSHFKVIG